MSGGRLSPKTVQNQCGEVQMPIVNSGHFAGLKVSVCTKFQVDSSYSLGVMVLKVILFLFHMMTPKFNMPPQNQYAYCTFNLIGLKPLELSSRNQIWPLQPQWPLTIMVMTPKSIDVLSYLWAGDIPGFKMMAINICYHTGVFRQVDGQTERWTAP